MSGGSQHNPNGRQSQLGSGWSPLQLQMANLLARAPQAHMASERGVTWHTPTPPPHLYHVPAPSPPDPLQAMKTAGNSVFRHTATPPELYRHTPTPPDKHLLRHTPSPDVKSGAALPLGTELFPHLGQGRGGPEKARTCMSRGVDLSLGARSNGAALSVRDAPTINSLLARAQPRHALLDRLVPSPVSPHSVIMHSRVAPTPSPPSSNEDSADSSGAPACKRKRKPDRTLRLPAEPPRVSPPPAPAPAPPQENGDAHQPPPAPASPPPPHPARLPPARRKSRTASAETIDDIAAMIASTADKVDDAPTDAEPEKLPEPEPELAASVAVDNLKSVLASPEPSRPEPVSEPSPASCPPEAEEAEEAEQPPQQAAAAPRRRSARGSLAEANVPVESPSEGKPAEPEPSEPAAASFVEVENQLEKMFAGLEEPAPGDHKPRKRRKSTPKERKAGRRTSGASAGDEGRRRRAGAGAPARGRRQAKPIRETNKDAYDSGSNASSSRSRGPYIQIRGPRDSPLSVSVINTASTGAGGTAGPGEEETDGTRPGRLREDFRARARVRGLHCSTLGLRYDATTPDATWLCVFCQRGPHYNQLGDLFGPYTIDTDSEEYRNAEEVGSEQRQELGTAEVWLHSECGVWAPGVAAAGARVWGLGGAVAASRAVLCVQCGSRGACLACAARACPARAHLPCARHAWALHSHSFQAYCPRHKPDRAPSNPQ